MSKKIRIGVLGGADIANRLVIPNLLQTGLFELVAVASRSAEKAESFAEKFSCEAIVGYDQLLLRSDIEAVYVPLPTGLHLEYITKALSSGKHVFAEKSIAATFEDTSQIISLARDKSLCVFENFMFVFHSQFDFVKQQLDDNTIGDIRLLRSSFGFPPFSQGTNIRYQKKLAGGALLDAGAYTVMASHFLLGRSQAVISASLEKGDWEIDYMGSAMLKSADGIVSQLAFGFDNFYQNNIELWGTKGKILIDRAFTAGSGFMPKIIIETHNRRVEHTLPPDNHFQKILTKFAECIHSGQFDFLFDQILTQSKLLTDIVKFS